MTLACEQTTPISFVALGVIANRVPVSRCSDFKFSHKLRNINRWTAKLPLSATCRYIFICGIFLSCSLNDSRSNRKIVWNYARRIRAGFDRSWRATATYDRSARKKLNSIFYTRIRCSGDADVTEALIPGVCTFFLTESPALNVLQPLSCRISSSSFRKLVRSPRLWCSIRGHFLQI